jgi:predicted nucleotide-binding protein
MCKASSINASQRPGATRVKRVDNEAIQARREGGSIDSVMKSGNREADNKGLDSASPFIGNLQWKWRRQAHPDLTETRQGCRVFVKSGKAFGHFCLFSILKTIG